MHYSLRHHLKRLWAELQYASPVPRRAQFFVVVAQERTGSTLLSTLLSYHPRVLMDMDVFFTPETWPSSRQTGRRVFSRRPVRGFKFKGGHAPLRDSARDARESLLEQQETGLRIVRLQRHDLLRQAISSYMVGARNGLHAWKRRSSNQTQRPSQIAVDVDDVFGRMEYFDRLTRFQDDMLSDVPHLALSYEENLLDAAHHQSTANQIFDHLGLARHPVETQLRKLTPNTLSDVVANVDELAERLHGTPYASFMEASPSSSETAPVARVSR
jgi:LPS sulfotransferase NodH